MTSSSDLRVLVVDDSPRARHVARKIVDSLPGCRVVGTAATGREAIARTLSLDPDAVLLDIEMPDLNGFGFLRWTLPDRLVPVIVVSARADDRSVFQCLEAGAVDFVTKPKAGTPEEMDRFARDLALRLDSVSRLVMEKIRARVRLLSTPCDISLGTGTGPAIGVVAIGASTGGPSALRYLLEALPDGFPAPLVVSQHMPAGYTGPFAERLNQHCRLEVREARDKDAVKAGRVLVAPGGANLGFIRKHGRVFARVLPCTQGDHYVPSVDEMFLQARAVWGKSILGILLTGMGSDGARGLLEIRRLGGYTIAESEESAVIFGMPGTAVEAGAAQQVLPLEAIPVEMTRVAGNPACPTPEQTGRIRIGS